MPKTVQVNFDKDVRPFLPKWAQKNPKVLEMCKKDLAYRVNVCSCETMQYRKFLIQQAETAIR